MKRVVVTSVIVSLIIIASIAAYYGLQSSLQVDRSGSDTTVPSATLNDVLSISYEKPGLDAVYLVPPPRDLYDSSIGYVQKGIRYLEEASINDDFIISRMREARNEIGRADPQTWEGLFHALRARDLVIEAMAYMNASKGTLTMQDVISLHDSISKRLDAMLAEDRYYGNSLSEALVSSYQVERHLYKAYTWTAQVAKLLESNRPVEVKIAYSYSALIAASTHMEIAEYIASNSVMGSDFNIEVPMLNQRLLDTVNRSLDSTGVNAKTVVEEAERLLNRAAKASDMGLHSYSIFDALHAYLLLKASMSNEFKDPSDDSWMVSAGDLYRAKLDTVRALEEVDATKDRIVALLVYRLYGYVSSGDELVASAVELGIRGGSGLLKTAYTEYMKAGLAAKHLQEALDLLGL